MTHGKRNFALVPRSFGLRIHAGKTRDLLCVLLTPVSAIVGKIALSPVASLSRDKASSEGGGTLGINVRNRIVIVAQIGDNFRCRSPASLTECSHK